MAIMTTKHRFNFFNHTKLLCAFFLLVVVTTNAHAEPKEVVAKSCLYEDVAQALAQTTAGDTLVLPEGRCEWGANSLEIKTALTVVGAGSDDASGTVLVRTNKTSAPLLLFNCLRNHFAFEVQRIKFEGMFDPSLSSAEADGGILSAHGCQDFLIHNNVFTGFANGGIDITDHTNMNPHNRGVIAKNRFVENFKAGLGYGVSVSSGGNNQLDIPFGGESYVFIEDNYFANNRHAVASNLDAAYVFRHNEIVNNYPNYTAIDTHGKTFSDTRGGTKRVEIYGNVIQQTVGFEYRHNTSGVINNSPAFAGIGLRGGSAVIYDNQILNYRSPIVLLIESSSPCDTLNPPFDDKQPSGVSVWNNAMQDHMGNVVTNLNFGLRNECQHMFREGVEYTLSELDGYQPYPYPHPLRPVESEVPPIEPETPPTEPEMPEDGILDFLPAIISGAKK